MSDDRKDAGPDPLSGKDPHPREQIDVWPLHDARQELLEEIVSQTGESPARRRVLLSTAGIAAALALVVGGAWAVTNDGSDGSGGDRDDAQVAASSDGPGPSDEASDPTGSTESPESTEPTTEVTATETAEPTKEPRRRDDVRRTGVRIGDVRTLRECLTDIKTLDRNDELTRLDKVLKRGKHHWKLYVVRKGRKAIAIGEDCKWIRVVPEKPRQRG